MQNADEEMQAIKVAEFEERKGMLFHKLEADAIADLLTAEQVQKMREFQLVQMESYFGVSARMFDALDLTDAQKQEMAKIKQELDAEVEKIIENYADGQVLEAMMLYEYRQTHGESGAKEDTMVIHQKLLATNPEYKKLMEGKKVASKAIAIKIKTKMFDVLTDEQWARLQKLIDDPPEYIKAFRKRSEELAAARAKKAGEYTPGPNAWQPGDPIPEEYRQQRNERRFPR
jgi:Ni/Co efflux regulator RcnB